jgi:hypothetical protein
MRALAVLATMLALLMGPATAAQLHVRVARAPHSVRATSGDGSAASSAASASVAVLGACPTQRTLSADCVDPETLGGAGACVTGPDGEQTTSAANASVQVCANASAIATAAETVVNASGNGIQAVDGIGIAWTSLYVAVCYDWWRAPD